MAKSTLHARPKKERGAYERPSSLVGQYTIECLYGDLLRARVYALVLQMGAGAGICIRAVIWHMHGYLLCYDKLTRVRRHAFINQVSLCDRRPQLLKNVMIAFLFAATFPGKASSSMSAGSCRSTYTSDTIHGSRQCMIEAVLLTGRVDRIFIIAHEYVADLD